MVLPASTSLTTARPSRDSANRFLRMEGFGVHGASSGVRVHRGGENIHRWSLYRQLWSQCDCVNYTHEIQPHPCSPVGVGLGQYVLGLATSTAEVQAPSDRRQGGMATRYSNRGFVWSRLQAEEC